MKNIPRFFSGLIGQLCSSQKLFSLTIPPFMPFYHVVSNEKPEHILNYPYRNTKDFETELDFILKYFEPVDLEYLLNHLQTKKKIFHLSFDDGLKECHEVIAPILKKKGIPATFFVNTGFIDNKALYYKYKASILTNALKHDKNKLNQLLLQFNIQQESLLKVDFSKETALDKIAEQLGINFSAFLETRTPYLTTNQLVDIKDQGFSIGAHSVNHPEFWLISEEEQYLQIKESMDWIQKNIQPKIKAFAFPYTDWGASAKVLKRIKTENICDITFGTAGVKYDEFDFHFQRYPMEKNGNFVSQLKSEFVYFQLRKWMGKEKVKH
jgi:peptidoglycan/xylan/chitin deacetylase (PgdA/CDA1 family)